MSRIQTLFLSEDYWVLNKNPALHSDEILTHRVNIPPVSSSWELVHRLDYETSGCLLLARSELLEVTRRLFQSPGKLKKIYLAAATESLEDWQVNRIFKGYVASRYRASKKVRFIFEGDAESLKAVRQWHSCRPASMIVKKAEGDPSKELFQGELYEVELLTGARHQIRAFFAACRAPIVGDPLYGKAAQRMELHAWKLEFTHPLKDERIEAIANLE